MRLRKAYGLCSIRAIDRPVVEFKVFPITDNKNNFALFW